MTHFPDRLVMVTSGGAAMVVTLGENREKLEASVFKEAGQESICSSQLLRTCEAVDVCLAHMQVVGGVAQGCVGLACYNWRSSSPPSTFPIPPAEAPVTRLRSTLAPGGTSRNKLFLTNTITFTTGIRDTTPSVNLGS